MDWGSTRWDGVLVGLFFLMVVAFVLASGVSR
jgi:hypothetical protein